MNINDRIRHLRKNELDMTQQEFSSKINISRSNMGNIETGEVSVTDRVISSICSVFNVNESWLRYGEGDIFLPKTRRQTISDFMSDLIISDSETFKERLIEALAQLEPFEWEILEKIAEKATKKS